MKMVRRLTVEIERRSLKITVREIGSAAAVSPNSAAEEPIAPCPRCGAAWIPLNPASSGAVAEPQGKKTDLRATLDALGFHVCSSPSGQLWVCERSISPLKENHQ